MCVDRWKVPRERQTQAVTARSQMLVLFVLAIVILVGCAQTRHVTRERDIDKSGFLGSELYEKLAPGDEKQLEPAFRWRDDTVNYGQYSKVMLDPVLLYRQPHHVGGGNTNENAQALIDYFHAKLNDALSKYVTIVDKPGPDTARLQLALVDYEATWVGLDMVSTLYPAARVLAEAKALAVEKPSFVGAVQAEFKLSDSESGQVMIAGIDRRVGGKTLSKGVSRWSDVHNAMDYWALQTAYRVCKLTAKPDCIKPTYGMLGTLKTETEK